MLTSPTRISETKIPSKPQILSHCVAASTNDHETIMACNSRQAGVKFLFVEEVEGLVIQVAGL